MKTLVMMTMSLLGVTLGRPLAEGENAIYQDQGGQQQVELDFNYQPSPTPWIENEVPISNTMDESRIPSTLGDQVPVRPVIVHAQAAPTAPGTAGISSSSSMSSSSSSSSSLSSSSSQSSSSEGVGRQTTQPQLNLEDNPENAAFELTDDLESVEQVQSIPGVEQFQPNPDVVQYSVSNSSVGQVPEWSLLKAGLESDTETTDNSLESKENTRRGLMLTYQLLRSPLMKPAVEPEETVKQLQNSVEIEKGADLTSDLPEDHHLNSDQHGYEDGLELGL